MRIICIGLLSLTSLHAQNPKADAFFKERERLQKVAKTALEGEMAREKAGDCPNANNTREMNECYGTELGTSMANYKAYVGALRAMLAQSSPWGEPTESGPTGKPLSEAERLAKFDQMERAWSEYEAAMTNGAFGLYKGGTIVNVMGLTSQLMLVRSHMRELAAVYGEALSH